MTSGVFKNSKLILQFCDSNYKQYVIFFSKESVAAKEHLTTVFFFFLDGGDGGVLLIMFFFKIEIIVTAYAPPFSN